MSEVVKRDAGELVTLSPEFVEKFPALDPEGENVLELLAENLGTGGEVTLSLGDFPRVKVPSGGGTMWMVPDVDAEDGEIATKTLTGVIVYMTPRRSYWPTSNPTGEPPSCRSTDLVLGEGEFGPGSAANPSGKCDSCPMSQMGSAGTGTKASKCKEQRLLFLLPPGAMLPYMITVPPGSLGALRQYSIHAVSLKRRKMWWIETSLGLEKATNDTGQDYAKIKFGVAGQLDGAERAAVEAYGASLAKMVTENADALADLVDGVVVPGAGVEDESVDYDDDSIPDDDVVTASAKGA